MAVNEQAAAAPVRGSLRPDLLTIIGVATLAALALVPLSGDIFYLSMFTRLMIFAIAAVSLNLILGYGGMVSLGHAAFIGIGAYSVGIPAYYDIYNGWLHLLVAVVACAAFAFFTGLVALRTKGVHFIMITLAFCQMVFFAFVSLEEYGGDDGLVINSRSEFWPLGTVDSNTVLYYVTLACLALAIFLVWRIVNSRFGMVIRGAKSNERRMHAIGHNTFVYQLVCYVIAGVMCGVAGVLMANFSNFISPEIMHWIRSGELIFMVILGGMGTVFGPLFGSLIFLLLEEYLSRRELYAFFGIEYPLWVYWRLIFGVLLILVVLYARGGLASILSFGRASRD